MPVPPRPLRSIVRILFEVRVGHDLGIRERVQVEMRIVRYTGRVGAVRVLALPRPYVAAACEHAVADEVGPAVSLPQQLAPPLGQNEVQRELGGGDVAGRATVRTLPQEIHVGQRLARSAARAAP